jgi:hypothetical protein
MDTMQRKLIRPTLATSGWGLTTLNGEANGNAVRSLVVMSRRYRLYDGVVNQGERTGLSLRKARNEREAHWACHPGRWSHTHSSLFAQLSPSGVLNLPAGSLLSEVMIAS